MRNYLARIAKKCRPGNAHTFHADFAVNLRRDGWLVTNEYEVGPESPGGRTGYIDIVATRDGERLAIELDRAAPRKKSVSKLMRLPGRAHRFAICRNVLKIYEIDPASGGSLCEASGSLGGVT